MTEQTNLLKLPYIMPSQAQKHVTHNESLRMLDALVQLSVRDRDLAAPPVSPAAGDRYLVAASPTGAWSGHAGHIAAWQDGAWSFAPPVAGWIAWVEDEDRLLVFDSGAWISAIAASLNPAALVGVNATADGTNRLAVKSAASLFDHEGGSHRLKINRTNSAATATILFQTNYSGRAEFGNAGDDRFRVKVSADGATWKTALGIDATSANVGIGTDAPEGPLHIVRTTGSPIHERVDDTAQAPTFTARKARGTPSVKTSVADGDAIQAFFAQAYDGASYVGCGNLRWVAEGTPTTGNVPTRVEFWTTTAGGSNSEKMRVTPAGNVGIGVTAPSVRLQVDGAIRTAQYAKTALPSAATAGAGAMAYVTDEAGGAVPAFSDGTNWRRVTDRAVVS